MNKAFIAIMMGSDSDLPVLEHAFAELEKLGIPFEANVLSAHRSPHATAEYVKDAEQRGCQVFIAAAGMAAHLAGAVAANTVRPVIGIPIDAGSLKGIDSLLSTVQMPGGVPVACTAIGKAGAKNAAVLAAQILALHDSALYQKLQEQRANKRQSLKQINQSLQTKLEQRVA